MIGTRGLAVASVVAATTIVLLSGGRDNARTAATRSESVSSGARDIDSKTHVVVDADVVRRLDWEAIQDSMWWTGNIYDGYEAYEQSLATFTAPQRMLYAMDWSVSEIDNGGFDQYFFNSTGIVFADALRGWKAIGSVEDVAIFETIVQRLGAFPDQDRERRQEQMERFNVLSGNDDPFDDLDSRFYANEATRERLISSYVTANAEAFFFDGWVKKPKPR